MTVVKLFYLYDNGNSYTSAYENGTQLIIKSRVVLTDVLLDWLTIVQTLCLVKYTGVIMCMHQAYERRRYSVTPSLIGLVHFIDCVAAVAFIDLNWMALVAIVTAWLLLEEVMGRCCMIYGCDLVSNFMCWW